jgi:hypothetical protein
MSSQPSDELHQLEGLIRALRSPSPNGHPIDGCEFLERATKIQRLLTWGILNPFGPTVESLCVAADPLAKTGILFAKTSNPFANSTVAYGAFGGDSDERLVPPVMKAIASITGATFIMVPTHGSAQQLDMFALVHRQMNAACTHDLAFEADRLKRFWLNPWARLPSMEEMFAGGSSPPPRPLGEMSKMLFVEWWALVTHPQHVISEWCALIEAWKGAIDFQRGSGNAKLAACATSAAEGVSFHRCLLNAEMAKGTPSE